MRTLCSFGATSSSTPLFFCRLAELPGAEQLVGVGLDLAALRATSRWRRRAGCRTCLRGPASLASMALRARRRHDVGLIDDAAGERRKIERDEAGDATTSAAADDARRDACGSQPRSHVDRAPRASELHLRRRLRAFVRGELRHRLVAAEERSSPTARSGRCAARCCRRAPPRCSRAAPPRCGSRCPRAATAAPGSSGWISGRDSSRVTASSRPSAPDSWFCASWNCLSLPGSVSCEASSLIWVALARASTTAVSTSFSCLA